MWMPHQWVGMGWVGVHTGDVWCVVWFFPCSALSALLSQIPPVLLELLASAPSSHFYSGCVVAEVRNFRGFFTSPSHCERSYLLLHPTHEVRVLG